MRFLTATCSSPKQLDLDQLTAQPDIDPEPTSDQRAAAEALITAERALVPDDPHHALLPPPPNPQFTPALQAELDRIASNPDPTKPPPPLKAIDLTRYEAPDLDGADHRDKAALSAALSRCASLMVGGAMERVS